MTKEILTPAGTVKVGSVIRIIQMNDTVSPSPAFPDGVDHQARSYNGKRGTVTLIDAVGQLHGTWGGLALIPEEDKFEIIS